MLGLILTLFLSVWKQEPKVLFHNIVFGESRVDVMKDLKDLEPKPYCEFQENNTQMCYSIEIINKIPVVVGWSFDKHDKLSAVVGAFDKPNYQFIKAYFLVTYDSPSSVSADKDGELLQWFGRNMTVGLTTGSSDKDISILYYAEKEKIDIKAIMKDKEI